MGEHLTCFYRLLGSLTSSGVQKSVPQLKLNATKSGCRSFTIKELLIRELFSEVAYSTSHAKKESLSVDALSFKVVSKDIVLDILESS